MRLVLTCLLLATTAAASAIEIKEIPSPTGPGAMGSSLTTGADGTVYLSWLEPADAEKHHYKFAAFDATENRWSEPRTIAAHEDAIANWADFPMLVVHGEGQMAAAWPVNHPADDSKSGGYRANVSTSSDGGMTWAKPRPVTAESRTIEFVTLQPTAEGRVMMLWLDGRNYGETDGRMSLCANFTDGSEPDMIVDDRVCDCCQISAAARTFAWARASCSKRLRAPPRKVPSA